MIETLFNSTVTLSVTFAVVLGLLCGFRITSPKVRRIAWVMVLVVGWIWVKPSVSIPITQAVYEPRQTVVEQTVKQPEIDGSLVFPLPLAAIYAEKNATNKSEPLDIATTVQHEPQASKQISWQFYVVAVWGGGIALIILRCAWRYYRFTKLLADTFDPDPQWKQQWETLLRDAKIKTPIPMRISETIGPMLVWRGRETGLVVPLEYWDNLTPTSRICVLQHEITHLLRRDIAKSFFVRILALPHWFNPLVWSAVKRFDDDAEWACDMAAISQSKTSLCDFAKALVQMHEMSDLPQTVYRIGFASENLSERIDRITNFKRFSKKDSIMKKFIVLILLIMLFAAVSVHFHFTERKSPIHIKVLHKQSATKTTPVQNDTLTILSHDMADSWHDTGNFASAIKDNTDTKTEEVHAIETTPSFKDMVVIRKNPHADFEGDISNDLHVELMDSSIIGNDLDVQTPQESPITFPTINSIVDDAKSTSKLHSKPKIDWTEVTSLDEFFVEFQKLVGYVVVPDAVVFTANKIDLNQDISDVLHQLGDDTSLASTLKSVLAPLGLDHFESGNTIIISSHEKIASWLVTKTYYVGDLVSIGKSGLKLGISSLSDSATITSVPVVDTSDADFEPLIDLIKSVTQSQWDDTRKIESYYSNKSLIIKQTDRVHNEIADLLEQLRKLHELFVKVNCDFGMVNRAESGTIGFGRPSTKEMVIGNGISVEYVNDTNAIWIMGIRPTMLFKVSSTNKDSQVFQKSPKTGEWFTASLNPGESITFQGIISADQTAVIMNITKPGQNEPIVRVYSNFTEKKR